MFPDDSFVVDALAVHRLTRLVIKDTFPPVRATRDWLLARWPNVGTVLDESMWRPVMGDRAVNGSHVAYAHVRYPDRRVTATLATSQKAEAGEVVVCDDETSIGELIQCPWCSSVYVAAGVVVARRAFPRLWAPVARLLAASSIAGWMSTHAG